MSKVAIVTGASRGIGRSCAIKLARENIIVIANYNKSHDKAEELKKMLESEEKYIDIFKADVTKKDEINNMIEYTIKKYGKIDILVNNARYFTNKAFYRAYRWWYK